MSESFRSFTIGLILSVILLYLVLVAQFRSFVDPFIILLALPPGITGVLLVLVLTGTTMNVMSLMGVVMLAGIAMSNSILIVEFAHHLRRDPDGRPPSPAADFDDFAGYSDRAAAHGVETGRRERVVCSACAGAGGRVGGFYYADGISGSGGVFSGVCARGAGLVGSAGKPGTLRSG